MVKQFTPEETEEFREPLVRVKALRLAQEILCDHKGTVRNGRCWLCWKTDLIEERRSG